MPEIFLLQCNKILDLFPRHPYIMYIVAVQQNLLKTSNLTFI